MANRPPRLASGRLRNFLCGQVPSRSFARPQYQLSRTVGRLQILSGATAKPAADATLLADSLHKSSGDVVPALSYFELAQLRFGRELLRYGVALGNRWTV